MGENHDFIVGGGLSGLPAGSHARANGGISAARARVKRVLVVYASAHGSTKGIAKEIGDRLTRAGLHADVLAVDEVEALETYEAVVIGSAIHSGAWLRPAAAFVRSHAPDLSVRPVWLFSVSSVGDTSSFFGPRVSRFIRRMRKDTSEIAGFRLTIRPRDHRNFAGAIQSAEWGRLGDIFLRVCGGRHGDHRDWRDIDAWADGIAQQVQATDEAQGRREEGHERLRS
jgi:menaquinone-dependent protoporphyrinogen oxidase